MTEEGAKSREIVAWRRCARDLAAISALPAIWLSADFAQALQNLADVLAATVRARFIYVRVERLTGLAEAVSSGSLHANNRDAAAIGREIMAAIDPRSMQPPATIATLAGEGPFQVAVSRIAATGGVDGFIVACSAKKDFPGDPEKLLLSTGAMQIAVLVQRSVIEAESNKQARLLAESNRQLQIEHASSVDTRRRLDATLAAAEIGTWTWEIASDTVVADPNLAQLLGLSAAKAEHAAMADYLERVHPDDRGMLKARVEEALEYRNDFSAEYRVSIPGCPLRWVIARGRVERDGDGKPNGITGVVLDITKRKLAEEQLRITRDAAEAANRAKDQFLAVLSHELRTPLSPILSTVARLDEDRELPERYRASVAMIRRNIELETQLIDDLLDVSRIASGKLRLQLQPVEVHAVLEHALETCRGEIAAKSLHIEQKLDAKEVNVIADPARLQQVFWNLLRNAAKFTPNGGHIFVRSWNPSDRRVAIEVRDTGVGIPAAALARVFLPFEQGETNVTRQFGGLGLGLAICKAVMETHGGSIQVFSAGAGKGATFTVEMAVSHSPTMAKISGSNPPAAMAPRRNRILLVEDHADTATSLAWLLSNAGYKVTTALTVASALEAAAQQPFDVMASDLGLPDRSGYELMQEVRRLYGLKGIALSGYGMPDDIGRARAAGFSDHIVKPVKIVQLKATLQRLLTDEPVPEPHGVDEATFVTRI